MLEAGGSKRHKELLAPFGLDASDPAFCATPRSSTPRKPMAGRREKPPKPSKDANTSGGRMRRYASTTAGLGSFAAKTAVNRMLGREMDMAAAARESRSALGGLKGPVMKVAQML
ncbi:hypothetical protein OY671_012002, partial [Metschnikowia pulcherrima]